MSSISTLLTQRVVDARARNRTENLGLRGTIAASGRVLEFESSDLLIRESLLAQSAGSLDQPHCDRTHGSHAATDRNVLEGQFSYDDVRHAAHKRIEIRDWLTANPRVQVHFTPTSGSWRATSAPSRNSTAKICAFIDNRNDDRDHSCLDQDRQPDPHVSEPSNDFEFSSGCALSEPLRRWSASVGTGQGHRLLGPWRSRRRGH
jgi:hypothetical protein